MFPVSQQYNKEYISRLMQEGDGVGNNGSILMSYSANNGIFPSSTIGAGEVIGGISVSHLKALYIDSIIVHSNKKALFFVQTGGNLGSGLGLSGVGTWTANANVFATTPDGGGSVVIPVHLIANGGYQGQTLGAAMTCFVRKVYDSDKTNCDFGVTYIGKYLTDDFNIGASKIILWKGDSISDGYGVTNKLNMLNWKIRNRLFDRTPNGVRLIAKTWGGTTSKWFDYLRRNSYFDYEQVDYIFYQLGVNDAVQGTSEAEYYVNIKSEIAYNSIKYPNAKQIYLGASPRNNGTEETILENLRRKMQLAVYEAANQNVFYCDLANSFDRTVLSNYYLNDGVHPNNSGHQAMFNVLDSFLTMNML
ncbi:SGNH/GDSL hydrolase family protein [Emticicia sp. TH156]|uniref:SGNH/GDSL hydrolase family protein n=1 Tax=Emticicia sp. TH156 TaxID=2067454 RepID=UPI000C76FB6A|nr:SGNH/GDSL hydrolase family protein [Emticicia sp. TH156]PLK44498.1 hypothetical protein C0V77_11995 [Emticicia sp. TH156]